MPSKNRNFINNEIYHVTVRRQDGRLMFRDDDDYHRAVVSLTVFNDRQSVSIWNQRRRLVQGQTLHKIPLVEILAFCLMPNHMHLLLRQIVDGGISKFMQKFGSGYSRHYCEKYPQKTRGHFFQNRFHSVHINNDDQLRTVFVYIHTNPIAVIMPNWKDQGVKNYRQALNFLSSQYRWSSYWDYLGRSNFSAVTNRDFLLAVMGGNVNCQQAVNDWLNHKVDLVKFKILDLPID